MITAQGRLLIALLGLCSALPTAAVQLPPSALAAGTPLILPAAQPLKGLDGWRLHGLFRQPGGSGWALLNIPPSQNQRAERGALLRDGIRLASIENDGVWLQRGQQRAFLRLSGGVQLHTPPEPEQPRTPDAEAHANCQQLVAGGVPLEELMTVGVCP